MHTVGADEQISLNPLAAIEGDQHSVTAVGDADQCGAEPQIHILGQAVPEYLLEIGPHDAAQPGAHRLGECAYGTPARRRPCSSTRLTSSTVYATSLIAGSSPIASAASKPGPTKSIMYPCERGPGARSSTVTSPPSAEIRFASVSPAIPAPQITTFISSPPPSRATRC